MTKVSNAKRNADNKVEELRKTIVDANDGLKEQTFEFKENEKKLSQIGIEKVSHMALPVSQGRERLPENKKLSQEEMEKVSREFPSRIAYAGSKLKISRTRLWYLQAMGSLKSEELTEYAQRYSKELTIDEQAVIELYLRSMAGDRDAQQQIWDLHKEIFKTMKSVYIEEMRQQRASEDNASRNQLTDMLSEIGKAIQNS